MTHDPAGDGAGGSGEVEGRFVHLDPIRLLGDHASGEGWVRVTRAGMQPGLGQAPRRIRVSYRAGLAGDPNGVPETLRQGIVRLAAHLYAHRERDEAADPPAAVTALWRPWRRLRLG